MTEETPIVCGKDSGTSATMRINENKYINAASVVKVGKVSTVMHMVSDTYP